MWYNGIFATISMVIFVAEHIELIHSQCLNDCNTSQNSILYPTAFLAFGSFEGQVFSLGQTVVIAAVFGNGVCQLPEPGEASSDCAPVMVVGLHTDNVTNCMNLVATPSTKQLERDLGFSFRSDPRLDTGSSGYNHWAFSFVVKPGMFSAHLQVKSLKIPAACNVPGRATFYPDNLVPTTASSTNTLLTPTIGVDSTPPVILRVSSVKPPGNYTAGDIIHITVEFDKPVFISEIPSLYSTNFLAANATNTIPRGMPFLNLNSGANALLLGYETPVTDKRRLSFVYFVGTGEETPAGAFLDAAVGQTIQLNGGSILSLATSMEADLTSIPAPGTNGAKIAILLVDWRTAPICTSSFFVIADRNFLIGMP
jgi:hypothetical protein